MWLGSADGRNPVEQEGSCSIMAAMNGWQTCEGKAGMRIGGVDGLQESG
jgi:hypothetical protein